ncbi:MAG: ribulose-phosphate 3-epimerase [Defluviitaleaceae bacterium]|nr:ribulose-phosphate 3-epimerase [Defluviitaleaceae bacterium]
MDIKISPSALACDLSRFAEECQAMYDAGAHMIHLDIMDGHFVPNLTFGAPLIRCLRGKSPIIFDAHLMISRPDLYIEDFVKAGADIITFHIEADCNTADTLKKIRSFSVKSGLSLKPGTEIEEVLPFIPLVDMILVMTVEPGFGGQSFMADMLPKVRFLRDNYPTLDIQVDGGLNNHTSKLAVEAGANIIVAGSYLFGQSDYKKAVGELYEICIQSAE